MSYARLPDSMRVFERGWLSSNNILCIGRDSTALVDSGYVSHADMTVALVERGLAGRTLDTLVNTHLHSDHCGGNASLQARYDCRTLIAEAEAESVSEWRSSLNAVQTGQDLERFRFDGTLAAGDRVRLGDLEWTVMAAPGHDPRSLMLFCENEGILISADALWEAGFGVIFPELVGEEGFAATAATLESIREVEPALVIPGHGAPFDDCEGALARAFSRLAYLRADRVRNAGHAVKVLLKFLLLDKQVLTMSDIVHRFGEIPIVVEANQRFLCRDPGDLARWAVDELVRLNAARQEAGTVFNVG